MKARQKWLSKEMAAAGIRPGQVEEEAYAGGFALVAGLDEVGVGPLAGPVMAAAVILPRGLIHPEIKDSKLLTAQKRETLAQWIKENAVAWGLGVVAVEEIDAINILRASQLAMALALKQLNPAPDYLLVDGGREIPPSLYETQDGCISVKGQRAIKKGDRLCLSIAAASIIAKVARDQLMMDYDRLYPQYEFARHKGYASAVHLAALRAYGPSPIHRKTFRWVKDHISAPSDAALLPLFKKK